MTLSFSLINKDYVVAVTDRRITSSRGVEDEEHDKTFVLYCNDAKMAVSFSGLAQCAGFDTHKWLLKVVTEIATPDYTINGIATRLCERLTSEFATNRSIRSVGRTERRLSVMLAGYRFAPDPIGIYAIISNWQDAAKSTSLPLADPEFQIFRGELKPFPPSVTVGVGILGGLDVREVVQLRSDALKLDYKAATQRMAYLLHKASDCRASGGLVGGQLTSIAISPDVSKGVESNYHVKSVARGTVMPACVWATSDTCMAVSSISVVPVEETTPSMSVPKTGRNKPCTCGSGKKYKYCHGRFRNQ